jgi:hypothetical protein
VHRASPLEERGWLRRERHPHDQRAVQLVLTDRGRAAADRLAGARRERLATLLEGVPANERDNVLRALEVLTAGLSKTTRSRNAPCTPPGYLVRSREAIPPTRIIL